MYAQWTGHSRQQKARSPLLAPHAPAESATGVWGNRLRTHAALPMPIGLSADCASVDARAGWVYLALCRAARARAHLATKAIHSTSRSLHTRGACPMHRRLLRTRIRPPQRVQRACILLGMWLSLRRHSGCKMHPTPLSLTRSAMCGPGMVYAIVEDAEPPPSATPPSPSRSPCTWSLHSVACASAYAAGLDALAPGRNARPRA